jgi:AAA15 family ATPase/GTPase
MEKNVPIERLCIENFITIKKFDWDIREFNILTGGMSAGKSICVKLLWFLERILHLLIFTITYAKDDLSPDNFYGKLATEFDKFFSTHGIDFSNCKIEYSYSYNGNKFDLTATEDAKKSLKWSSKYLDAHLKQWQGFFDQEPILDTSKIVSTYIFESISKEFAKTFPMGALFIPASRVVATIIDRNTGLLDPFLTRFLDHRDVLHKYLDKPLGRKMLQNETYDLLRLKAMKVDKNRKLKITTLKDGEIFPEYLSSGQQELLYLLLLLNYVKALVDDGYTPLSFSERTSIFIEEPEAHLFPQNQKEILEYIVATFRLFRDKKKDYSNERFFITTHSPYILNVASTMMNRGRLREKIEEQNMNWEKQKGKSSNARHYFNKGEVAAYYIEDDGIVPPIVADDEDEVYMYVQKMHEISQDISDEANAVDDELTELERRGT